jgi:hypothetical protein
LPKAILKNTLVTPKSTTNYFFLIAKLSQEHSTSYNMLEYFSQRYPTDCTKKILQKVGSPVIELELRGPNYQTPFYADCILKYQENCHKIYFSADNSCNFKAISKSNILKQIYKGEK